MSLEIIDYPVKVVGQNVFGGDSPVEVAFKRIDSVTLDSLVTSGIDNTIIIPLFDTLGNQFDVPDYVKVGDFVSLSTDAEGFQDINLNGGIVEILPPQNIRVAINKLPSFNLVWTCNFKQNYYIELDIIDSEDEDFSLLPFTLTNDGKGNGNVIFDLSIINDLNTEVLDFKLIEVEELRESRQKFNIKYREIFRDGSTAYVSIDNPIIITTAIATTNPDAVFFNAFSEPNYYKGYLNGAIYLHSDSAPSTLNTLKFSYEELDINKESISTENEIGSIEGSSYGKIFVPLVDLQLSEDTKYITLSKIDAALPDFSESDFSNEFKIT